MNFNRVALLYLGAGTRRLRDIINTGRLALGILNFMILQILLNSGIVSGLLLFYPVSVIILAGRKEQAE